MRQEPSEETSYYCDQLKEMRSSGKLQEAYRLGKQLHERYPSDEFIENAFSWVIYDCLKRYKDEDSKYHKNFLAFLQTLKAIPALKFDASTNDLFYENVARYIIPNIGWDLRSAKNIDAIQTLVESLSELDANEESQVYETMLDYLEEPIGALGWDYRKTNDSIDLLRLLNTLATTNTKATSFLKEPLVALGWDFRKTNNVDGLLNLLNSIISLGDAGSTFRNSDVLLMFIKGFEPTKNPNDMQIIQMKKAEGVITLVEWFGLENLTQSMFAEEEYQGKKQQSLAEKLVNRYTDVLGMQNQEGQLIFDQSHIRAGLNSLPVVLQSSYAESWIWPQYKYGKLLMRVDGAQEARPFFAKVLLDKWGESYIWGAFADTFTNEDQSAYERCLFRGLRIAKDVGYSLSLHEKAMLHLKSIQRYPEAKREALIVSEFRKGQGWPESNVVESQLNEEWFSTMPVDDNSRLYEELSLGAEEYIFPYASKADFYVEWKDAEKGLMGIVTETSEEPKQPATGWFYRTNHYTGPEWARGLRRTVVKDREVMTRLETGHCYSGVLSKDARTILGGIGECASDIFAGRFSIEFEGTFDLVKYKDKQGNDKVIGFVRDTQRGSIFVPPIVFKDKDLVTFDIVEGTARAIFKDDRWTMEVQSLQFHDKPNPEEIEKEITGYFESTMQSFGFVEGCFVPKGLIFSEKLRDDDRITVLARKSWDKKKGKWGWTATAVLSKER